MISAASESASEDMVNRTRIAKEMRPVPRHLSSFCSYMHVLIAACDTFRSGAVEQLRVHVKNLGMLVGDKDKGAIELYEKGYGKDAAGIAKEAIAYGELAYTSILSCVVL